MSRFLRPSITAFLFAASSLSQQLPSESDRLAAVAKVWVTVKYFHPYMAYRDIDWDKALVDVLPKIRSASTTTEYGAAVQSMLDRLADTETYVFTESAVKRATSLKFEKRADGTLVISEADAAGFDGNATKELRDRLETATRAVFDLRGSTGYLSSLVDQADFRELLVPAPLEIPGQRTWVHNGLEPQTGVPVGGFHSAFYVKAGAHLAAKAHRPDCRIAFIVGQNALLPEIAVALARSGLARVISASTHYEVAGTERAAVSLGSGLEVIIRLSEPIFTDGTGAPEFAKASEDTALEHAIDSITHPAPAPAKKLLPTYPAPIADPSYDEPFYPSPEYRILAACKIWGTFRYFFAYKDLMDEDWDDVFNTFLPRFVSAKDAREFHLTVAEMITHVNDSHATVRSKALDNFFGESPVGLRMRLIEKKPVITEVLDEDAKKAGIKPGDIVTKVDGEGIIERVNREAHYLSSSTQQSLGSRIVDCVLNGPDGSTATLAVLDRDSQTRQVSLKRSVSFVNALRYQRTGDVIKLVRANIGYVDLDRLTPDQVDAMFEKLRDTKAIIFDMRGYPRDTASSIAPRLTEEKEIAAAIITGPLTLTPDLAGRDFSTQSASYFLVRNLPQTDKWKYKGKTVMLVDERTEGEAEYAGLLFEVANKTEFIGSSSAGATGEVTNFTVPGGITVSFSGCDIRHANGGKLQRLGLQPSITISPTIAGIRSARDEVLEKAIEYVSETEGSRRASHDAAASDVLVVIGGGR